MTTANNSKDCLSCRLISSLTLTGIGIHALRHTRPKFPGSPASKAVLMAVGTGLTIMGLIQGMDIIKDPNWQGESDTAVLPAKHRTPE